MLSSIGLPELLLVSLIVLMVFGVGRITKVAGELGSGINAFRKGLKGDTDEETTDKN
jgi:sec-independent protein translocase protein TatA